MLQSIAFWSQEPLVKQVEILKHDPVASPQPRDSRISPTQSHRTTLHPDMQFLSNRKHWRPALSESRTPNSLGKKTIDSGKAHLKEPWRPCHRSVAEAVEVAKPQAYPQNLSKWYQQDQEAGFPCSTWDTKRFQGQNCAFGRRASSHVGWSALFCHSTRHVFSSWAGS